jgi:hypothetical protein
MYLFAWIKMRRTSSSSPLLLDAQALATASPAPRPGVAADVADRQRTPSTI